MKRNLIPDIDKDIKTVPTLVHIKIARLLRDVIIQNKRKIGYIDLGKWADSIRLLEQVDKNPIEEILQTMEWYIHHIEDRGVPKCPNGKYFRQDYGRIANVMARYDQDEKRSQIELDDSGKRVLREIVELVWNRNTYDDLRDAIAASMVNYVKAQTVLRGALKKLDKCHLDLNRKVHRLSGYFSPNSVDYWTLDTYLLRSLNQIKKNLFTCSEHGIEAHFKSVWRSTKDWLDWDADLSRYIWSPMRSSFTKQMLVICYRQCNQGETKQIVWQAVESIMCQREDYL